MLARISKLTIAALVIGRLYDQKYTYMGRIYQVILHPSDKILTYRYFYFLSSLIMIK